MVAARYELLTYRGLWRLFYHGCVQVQPKETPVVSVGVPLGQVILRFTESPALRLCEAVPLHESKVLEIVQARVVSAPLRCSVNTREAPEPGGVAMRTNTESAVQFTGIIACEPKVSEVSIVELPEGANHLPLVVPSTDGELPRKVSVFDPTTPLTPLTPDTP